jgi:endonuclease G
MKKIRMSNFNQKLKAGLMILLLSCIHSLVAQTGIDFQIQQSEIELERLNTAEKQTLLRLEDLKLQRIRRELSEKGLPKLEAGEQVVIHSAFSLLYNEQHEQAKWVAHIIIPDVASGLIGRSNDFRVDTLIPTGSATEADYFIKTPKPDGTPGYDGFGFDRGHLAPSADFRWSAKALSESFLYSNMSPQRPEFNRVSWARLEDLSRSYVERSKTQLFVVTGPVLRDNLPKVERGINKVSIPVYYYKVLLDLENERAIAFVMPNKACDYPTENYAVSIDSVESLTGIDFFPALPDDAESKFEQMTDYKPWLAPKELSDVKPLNPTELPKKHFNTVQAKSFEGLNERIAVCGTVVSTKLSSKGNVFLNLDKGFPNQIFTVSIFKDRLANFSYAPQLELMGKVICIEGKVSDFNGTPSMVVENEKAIRIIDEFN